MSRIINVRIFFYSIGSVHSIHNSLTFSFFARKCTIAICSFSSFLAHHPLPLPCRFECISNQRATDKRPILITLSFAYLHINDCRLCCFSAAVVPLPSTLLRLSHPTNTATLRLSLSARPHIFS